MTLSLNQGRFDRAFLRTPAGAVVGQAVTGLQWTSNTGVEANSMRFSFTGANLPTVTPLTLIWRLFPIQQTGYYTTFFWGDQDTPFNPDVTDHYFFGCHPYPDNFAAGVNHNWEISIQAQDIIADDNSNDTTVVKGQWYQQAAVATDVGGELRVQFYWDLATSTSRVITFTSSGAYLSDGGHDSPALTFGDAPWSPSNEMLSGILRGVQIFQAALNTTQINALRVCETNASALSVAAAQSASHWYLNINPTPSDITDKSGNGRNPSWLNANRPTLWQG